MTNFLWDNVYLILLDFSSLCGVSQVEKKLNNKLSDPCHIVLALILKCMQKKIY